MILVASSAARLYSGNEYLLILSRVGLFIPKSDMIQHVSISFVSLELTFKLIRETKVPERKDAEYVLFYKTSPPSCFCPDHLNEIKMINRTICNFFFNNYRELQKDEVHLDSVKYFKQRLSKRLREE